MGRLKCLLVLSCASLAGCIYSGSGEDVSLEDARSSSAWQVVEGVEEARQDGEQDCGAVVVAELLRYWGDPASVDQIRREAGAAPEKPIHAGVLRDVVRARGFAAFLVHGKIRDLRHEIRHGRPVVVGMLKPHLGDRMLAHYELVVGVHEDGQVMTMDPAAGFRRYPAAGFVEEWRPTGRLMLVAAPRGHATTFTLRSHGLKASVGMPTRSRALRHPELHRRASPFRLR